MKRILLVIGFVIFGLAVAELFLHMQHQAVQKKVAEQKKLTGFSLERAPSNTLRGSIASMSGTIKWQSRIATQPAELKQPRTIQQGEELWTGKDGKITLQLEKGPLLTLLPKSHVNFIQTLPSSIVLKQDQGTVIYQSVQPTNLSITSLDLLTSMQQGTMTVTVNENLGTVLTAVTSGGVTEAFNGSDNTTSVTTVAAGQTFSFDDTSLTGVTK